MNSKITLIYKDTKQRKISLGTFFLFIFLLFIVVWIWDIQFSSGKDFECRSGGCGHGGGVGGTGWSRTLALGWTLDTELLEGYLHFRIDADDGRSIVELVAVTGCREDGDELTIPDHEFIAILNDLKYL